MKNKFFLYLFCSISFVCQKTFSQNLNFTDLEYSLSHRIDESDTYFAKKGFEFSKYVEKSNDYSCATTRWAYARNISNDKAVAFVARYCDEPNQGFVWFQPADKKTFESIKAECLKLGFKFKEKYYENEISTLNFVYVTSKYKIEFSSGINIDNNNAYSITLRKL